METNIILCGVGGQGILLISQVIDRAALKQGLHFKQAEVHGMSQRGGAVISHLRVADHVLHSDLVPKGRGTLILSVEPLESLRYLEFLTPDGQVVSGIDPYINIENYPEADTILDTISTLAHHTLVPAEALARQAGNAKAQNTVLLGAASPYLGLQDELIEECLREAFAHKGEKVQKFNVDAFRTGKAAGEAYRGLLTAGLASRHSRALVSRLTGGLLAPDAVAPWKDVFAGALGAPVLAALKRPEPGKIPGLADVPRAILAAGDGAAARLDELLYKRPAV